MTIPRLDLNLLYVFAELAEHRSVTRAAERLGLTQPSTSAALRRLRLVFGDPLFVRAGAQMEPTPRAHQLTGPIRRILESLHDDVLQATAFDAATSRRSFTIMAPDIGEVNLVPRLLRELERSAPGVDLHVVSVPRRGAAEALENGSVDLAVGYYPELQKSGFFLQRLFRTHHVCIVRKDHPEIGGTISLRQFAKARHAVVEPDGGPHVFDQSVQAQGLERRVQLRVAHFMSLLPIIASSDLVATVPRDLGRLFESYGSIRIVQLQMKAPEIDVHQFWHRRNHHDAAHEWLRATVHRMFESLRTATEGSPPNS